MVLTRLVAPIAKAIGVEISLLHVNYGLRGEESEEDARFVEAEGGKLGLKVQVLRAPVNPKGKVGIQNWARQLRYSWFSEVAGEPDIVLLAHHEGDLVETILMRIMRGSSLTGLMGMKAREGKYLRPLLSVPRADIESFARDAAVAFREDSSNASLDYNRNRLRLQILPELETMFPGAAQNLLELARSGQEWSQYFTQTAGTSAAPDSPEAWRALGFYPASQRFLLDLESLATGEFSATKPSRPWLEALYQSLICGANSVLQLDEAWEVRIAAGQYEIRRKSGDGKTSPRWLQYQGELTKSGLASSLSPGARLEPELDDDREMQDNKNAGVWSK